MAKPKLGRALTSAEAKSGNYSPSQVIRYENGIYLKPGVSDYVAPTPDQSLQTPQDLLGIYKQAFGEQAGQALYQSLQAPTPLSNDQLAKDFGTQFNPYFQDLQNQYGQDFATQNQRAQQDYNYNTGQFEQQATTANQNAIGNYNQQYGDAFGSPMQQQAEAKRQEALQQQRDQMQQNYQRKTYDLNQLNTQNLKNLENQRQTAQGNYANEFRYSNVLG